MADHGAQVPHPPRITGGDDEPGRIKQPRAANRRSNASGLGDLGGAEAEGEEEEEDGGGDGVGTFLVENSSSLVRDFAVRPSR